MASVNMAIVVGFVGDDPRVNSTQSGRKVASFSLATTEKGYTTQSGQQIPDRTEWHNIVCWGKFQSTHPHGVRPVNVFVFWL